VALEVTGEVVLRDNEWIDIHCHYSPPRFTRLAAETTGSELDILPGSAGEPDILVRYGRRIEFLTGELSRMIGLDERVARMDATGAALQVISPPTFFAFYEQPPDVAAYLVSALNDGVLEGVAQYPDRLLAMVTLPLQDAGLAVRELERVRANPAVRGVIVGSSIAGRQLDDPSMWPFYEAAAEMGVGIFIHPASSDLAGADRMQEYFLHNLIGNPANTTLAAARLIFGGVLTRYPELRICLAHAGGYLAWALGRLTRGHATHVECREHTDEPPADQARRLYIDSIAHASRSLEYALSVFGADRLVCGSDYPFEIGDQDALGDVDALNLGAGVREDVLRGNALRFLGIDPPSPEPMQVGRPARVV
jgi:aminocarboxymuconate-semialdehyde decarboxylase